MVRRARWVVAVVLAGCGQPFFTPRPLPVLQVLDQSDPRRDLVGSWRLEFMVDSSLDTNSRARAASGAMIKGSLELLDSLHGPPPYQTQRVVVDVDFAATLGWPVECFATRYDAATPKALHQGVLVELRRKGKEFRLWSILGGDCHFRADGRFGADTANGGWSEGHTYNGDRTWGRFRMIRSGMDG